MADLDDVQTGIAELLDTHGVATYAVEYTGSEPLPVVTFGQFPLHIDAAVTLRAWSDLPKAASLREIALQVLLRGPAGAPLAPLVQAVTQLLHDRRYLRLGGAQVSRIRLDSSTDLKTDELDRPMWSLNFTLTGQRPTASRLPEELNFSLEGRP